MTVPRCFSKHLLVIFQSYSQTLTNIQPSSRVADFDERLKHLVEIVWTVISYMSLNITNEVQELLNALKISGEAWNLNYCLLCSNQETSLYSRFHSSRSSLQPSLLIAFFLKFISSCAPLFCNLTIHIVTWEFVWPDWPPTFFRNCWNGLGEFIAKMLIMYH